MDQDKQKTSDFDLLMGDEMDDDSFEALWEEASKPLADKTGTSETDPLLASTIGRLLDWDDISNDKALWNELDARVAAKNLEKIVKALPALHAPTVNKLNDPDWFAVETVVEERLVRDLIPPLRSAGATGIIELALNKVIF